MQLPMAERARLRRVRGMRENEKQDEDRILDALKRARQPVTARQVADHLGMGEQLVLTRIRGLREKGSDLGPNLATDDKSLGEALARQRGSSV